MSALSSESKHDLLTQMTIIRGHIELLQNGSCGNINEQAQESIQKIQHAATAVIALLQEKN